MIETIGKYLSIHFWPTVPVALVQPKTLQPNHSSTFAILAHWSSANMAVVPNTTTQSQQHFHHSEKTIGLKNWTKSQLAHNNVPILERRSLCHFLQKIY
jgi:hypothetical protein